MLLNDCVKEQKEPGAKCFVYVISKLYNSLQSRFNPILQMRKLRPEGKLRTQLNQSINLV